MKKLAIALGILFATAACTDTERARMNSYGDPHKVTCYSGGKITYQGVSTGRVHSPEHSDGWQFQEEGSRALIEVSGDCVIRVD